MEHTIAGTAGLQTRHLLALGLGAALLAGGLLVDLLLLLRLRRGRLPWRARLAFPARRPWREHDAALLGVALLLLHGIAAVATRFTLRSAQPATGEFLAAMLWQTLCFHGAGYGLVRLLMKIRRLSWDRAFGLNSARLLHDLRRACVGYLAATPAVALTALVYQYLLTRLGAPAGPQDVVSILSADSLQVSTALFLTLLAVFVAPLAEELLFRGVALPVLARRLPPPASIGLVSLAFALLHFHVPSLAPLFVIAVAFAVAYLVTGSLLVPILMHALFNGISLLAVFLLRDSPWLT